MSGRKSNAIGGDVRLIPRVKEYVSNVPSNQQLLVEDVAEALMKRFPEYARKKQKMFVRAIEEAFVRLEVNERPSREEEEEEESGEEGGAEGVEEMEGMELLDESHDRDIQVVEERPAPPSALKARKRKLDRTPTAKKVAEVNLSSDEAEYVEEAARADAVKRNTSNKFMLNLYSGSAHKTNGFTNGSGSGALATPPATEQTSEKKKGRKSSSSGSAMGGGPAPASARGLGKVPTLDVQPKKSTVRFEHLGGCDRQFLEVCRMAMHMKRPRTFACLGVQPPRGFLVHGPPGCGKTMFAQAVAGQLEVPLLQLAATELVSGVSGETEEKIRMLFDMARKNAPCVLVLDDIDSIAPRRETATREMERRVVSQLQNSMDELFGPKKEKPLDEQILFGADGDMKLTKEDEEKEDAFVLVIGTTSRPDSVDGGLRRAGRFDAEIALGIPDEEAREKILKTVCSVPLCESVSLRMVARLTPGYVGADLSALVREAAKCAVNRIFDTIVQTADSHSKQLSNEEARQELEKVLAWLEEEDDPQQLEQAGGFTVEMDDFNRAQEKIQPSAKREGFATVPDVSWEDIGALSDVRQELEWNILYPVKRPEDFALLGISTRPQGILLCGPPGCGKTLLAKAVANETGMNFISVKGPELLNMYVGESERAVRTVFQRARDSSPCVIFFDEIDALCPKRSGNENSGGARLVNQLLTEMDGVEGRKQVFLIGATNRPDIVDPAILRPGRLDKILFVNFPSLTDRADILRKSTKNGTRPRLSDDVSFDALAAIPQLDGFTGADLAALVHEASIVALKDRLFSNSGVEAVHMKHFVAAVERIRPSVTESDRRKYARMRETYAATGGKKVSKEQAGEGAVVGGEGGGEGMQQ